MLGRAENAYKNYRQILPMIAQANAGDSHAPVPFFVAYIGCLCLILWNYWIFRSMDCKITFANKVGVISQNMTYDKYKILQHCYPIDFLYANGEKPVTLLNIRVKWCILVYPSLSEIWVILYSSSLMRFFASMIFNSIK